MMDINQNLTISTQQRLTISPQLQHAIKLLQMSNIELVERIQNEIAENPFLEENPQDEGTRNSIKPELNGKKLTKNRNKNQEETVKPMQSNGTENHTEPLSNHQDDDIETYFGNSSDAGYTRKEYRSDDNDRQNFIEATVATSETIYDHLMSQLRLTELTGKDFEIGEMIITSLNSDGLLDTSIKEIARSAETTADHVEAVLTSIQRFDPPGIAARDLKEALIIQVRQDEHAHPLVESIIQDHLRYLEMKKYKELASKLAVGMDDIKEAEQYIRNLEPYPARDFDTQNVKFIIPDIFVKKVEDGFEVIINDDFLPKIQINTQYRKWGKDCDNKVCKNFLDKKYSEAKLLLFSLDRRRDTIFRVVNKIVELQRDFFFEGPKYLQPLVLRQIAESLGMHESTVSRVTTEKYMDTPWGIFELKYFFSSGIRKSSGELKSSTSVKEIIRQIIVNESNKALSDQKIVDILSNQGIKISRRTVNKYRNSLNIFPSYQRKRI